MKTTNLKRMMMMASNHHQNYSNINLKKIAVFLLFFFFVQDFFVIMNYSILISFSMPSLSFSLTMSELDLFLARFSGRPSLMSLLNIMYN